MPRREAERSARGLGAFVGAYCITPLVNAPEASSEAITPRSDTPETAIGSVPLGELTGVDICAPLPSPHVVIPAKAGIYRGVKRAPEADGIAESRAWDDSGSSAASGGPSEHRMDSRLRGNDVGEGRAQT